jgi:hypothetical protein
MIERCFNPLCKIKLHYLRDGRVVRVIREKAGEVSVEHYWLCGPCYESCDFEFSPDGSVNLRAKSKGEYADEFHFRDVLLQDRRKIKRGSGPVPESQPNLRSV